MSPVDIRLTWSEMWQASLAGCQRRIVSMAKGLDKNKHAEISDWSTDINGAAAELAYAKHIGAYWGADVNTFKAPDVGDIQVRSTCHENGHLIVRRNDNPNDLFVFVVTALPICRIVGAITGADAMRDIFWRGDSWWVPQSVLTMETKENAHS